MLLGQAEPGHHSLPFLTGTSQVLCADATTQIACLSVQWPAEALKGCALSQAAIDVEKQRLASVRVRKDSGLAQEAGLISGQQVPSIASLEELLRRPHVHYKCDPTLPTS